MKPTTRAQREAVFKLFRRDFPAWTSPGYRDSIDNIRVRVPLIQYIRFRRKFRWHFDEYLGGEWKGMFVGIEPDGYTHT